MLLFTHILSVLSLRIMESCYVNLMNLNLLGSEKKIAKVMGQTNGLQWLSHGPFQYHHWQQMFCFKMYEEQGVHVDLSHALLFIFTKLITID